MILSASISPSRILVPAVLKMRSPYQRSGRVSAAGEGTERGQHLVDVGGRVVSADLEADLLIPTGDNRIIEPSRQNAGVAQMRDENGRARRISHHKRHDRVLAGQRFEAEDGETVTEAGRHLTEVTKELLPARAVDDLNGFERGGGLRRRNRVRVNVEWRGFPQISDDCRAAGDIAAIDAKRLPKRAD